MHPTDLLNLGAGYTTLNIINLDEGTATLTRIDPDDIPDGWQYTAHHQFRSDAYNKPLGPSAVAYVPPSPKSRPKSRPSSAASSPNRPKSSQAQTQTPSPAQVKTRSISNLKDLLSQPEIIEGIIQLANSKPLEYAPKIKFININKKPLPRRRYITEPRSVPIETLYKDIEEENIEIVPNKPLKIKDKEIPPLDVHFFKYTSRSTKFKKKSIKYNLV